MRAGDFGCGGAGCVRLGRVAFWQLRGGKIKRKFWIAASLLVGGALFWAAKNAASWRPQKVARVGAGARHALVWAPRSRLAVLGFDEVWDFSGAVHRVRSLGDNDAFYSYADSNSYWSARTDLRPPSYRGRAVISRRDLRRGAALWSLELPTSSDNPIRYLKLSPGMKRLCITRRKNAESWDIASKRRLQTWTWREDMDALAGVGGDKIFLTLGEEIIFYDLKKRRVIWQQRVRNRIEKSFERSPDGKTVWVISDKPNRAQFFDAASGKRLWQRALPWQDTVPPVQFSPDGGRVHLAHWAGIEILDARNGRKLAWRALPRFERPFVFALTPDLNWLYTLRNNGDLERWRMR